MTELIRVTFTEADVESIADENGVDLETARERAANWASSIQDTLTETGNQQLTDVIVTGNP